MGEEENEEPHYNYDSDGEPPTDQVGDRLTIIKKQQVVKTILEVGNPGVGKPGRPYIVKVNLRGFFAPEKKNKVTDAEVDMSNIITKSVDEKHIRIPADDIKGEGETFIDHLSNNHPPIQLTLGDDRLPYGLWKSIEHMRKGELAKVMIKPKWGYNYEKN